MDALIRHILDHQSTAVLLVDDGLTLRYLNQAAEHLLDTSRARSLGSGLHTVLRNGEDFTTQLEGALEREQPFTKRLSELTIPANGNRLTADVTATPVSVAEFHGLLLEVQPLDRLLRINREDSERQVQQTTRELVRGLAHEIKNPLGGIRGAAQLLSRELPEPRLTDYTSVIIEEADRLRNLVDRMLGPNRVPRIQKVNVHRVIERVLRLIDAEVGSRVRLERDYDPSIPELACDDEQLVQALLNIARNAADALEKTEEARITLRTRASRQVTINGRRHRLVLRIDVEDNGPGVPPELKDRLFYPMISGRADGSGLGLAIAQAIVGQHGGVIQCDSRPGKTRFTLLLPFTAGAEEPTDEAS